MVAVVVYLVVLGDVEVLGGVVLSCIVEAFVVGPKRQTEMSLNKTLL